MAAQVTEAFLGEVQASLEGLLARPELLLDPESEEAQRAARSARAFLKRCAEGAGELGPAPLPAALAVEGLDREQIWEQLEVQNVPVRRQLRRLLTKFAERPSVSFVRAPDSPAEEEEKAAPARPRKAAKKKRGKAEEAEEAAEDAALGEPAEGQEDFFDEEEMNRFLDLGDEGKLRLNLEAGDSDFEELEVGSGEEGVDAGYADFFGAPQKKKGKAKEEEEGLRDEEPQSEEEKALDAELRRFQGEGDDEGEEEEPGDEEEADEEGAEEDDAEDAADDAAEDAAEDAEGDDDAMEAMEEAMEEEGARKEGEHQSLYDMDRQLQALEEEVAKLEAEQLEAKPWSQMGEVSARQRPLNSLLEVHVDQPMTHFAARRAEDGAVALGGAPGEEADEEAGEGAGLVKQVGIDIEAMIRQRIWDESYDDVERRSAPPPSQRAQTGEEETVETLNFEKSRVGLGEVYAQKYEAEMLGHAPEQEKEARAKTEAKAAFTKLMYKLDQLTNAHFTPRPAMLGASGKDLEKVASLKMEETIPLLVSDTGLKAPEEMRAPMRHARGREELTHDERVAARRLGKDMRKRKLAQRVEGGEMSLQGMREREAKLASKNLQVKQEKAKQGEVKEKKKRLKASELLQQAAKNATTREEDKKLRKKKANEPSGQDSKKVKL